MPAVSFIIPTKDRAGELAEALASLQAQTASDWEALVVDDASTEDIAGLIRSLDDDRIRHVPLPADRSGAPAGRNYGVEQARSELIIFLDSDDAVAPGCVERRLEVMCSRPELDFAVFQCGLFMERPGDLPFTWNTFSGRPGESDLDRFLSRDNVWQTTAPIWRRDALARFAPWNEQVPSSQDWEFHVRALAAGLTYEKFNEIDCYWRRPSEARSSIGKQTFEAGTAAVHARARPVNYDGVREVIEEAGLMTPLRRRMFVGMYWGAAQLIAQRASFREARTLWNSLRRRRVISARDYLLGRAYLLTGRWPKYTAFMNELLERRWDVVPLVRRRPEYLLHRLDGSAAPAVTVLMTVHNAWRTVEESIRSILSQQWQDFELIVVDDGSTDGTWPIIRRLAAIDARIRPLRLERRDLVQALRMGLAEARGEFVARMAADATARFGRLACQVRHLREHPEVVLVGGCTREFDDRRNLLGETSPPAEHAEICSRLQTGDEIALSWRTAMMRRSAIDAAGGFPETLQPDIDLFRRLTGLGKVANLPDILLWLIRPRGAAGGGNVASPAGGSPMKVVAGST